MPRYDEPPSNPPKPLNASTGSAFIPAAGGVGGTGATAGAGGSGGAGAGDEGGSCAPMNRAAERIRALAQSTCVRDINALLLLFDLDASRVGVQLQDGPATVEGTVGISLTRSPTFFGLDLQFREIGIDAALLAGIDQRLNGYRQAGREQDADVADRSLDTRLRDFARLSHELGCDTARTGACVHAAPESVELNVAAARLGAYSPSGRSQRDSAATGFHADGTADVADVEIAPAAFCP